MNRKRLLIVSTICFVIVFLALVVWSKAEAATKMTYTSGFDTDDDGKVDVLDLSAAGFVKTDVNGVPSSTIELATPTHAGAPTANDDTGDGYVIGSLWTDSTTGCQWIATDVTVGAAVWINQCRPPLTQNYILVGNASGISEATNILPIITFGNGATSSGYFYLLEDADNGTNKIKVEAPQSLAADLTLTLTGGYDTIYIDAAAMIPSTTNGALQGTKEYGTNDIDIDYFAFDAGATEERVQFKLKMPENWDIGTIKVKFDWTSDTGSTAGDTVEWGIKAGALSNDDAIDAALGTAQVITDTLLANNGTDLQTTGATPALTVGGTPALGDVIVFEVYRNTDGTDDMAEDAWLTGITIQYSKAGVPVAW